MQRTKTCCFLVIACAFVLAATSATAQTIVISSQPTCPNCTIQWAPIVMLGDADGPGGIGSLSTITQLADGRYVASFDETDEELVVFSPDGRYNQRFGRRGEGPGEFQFIRWVRAHGSELHVFDGQLLRQTVLSPDFRVIRTNRFPVAPFGDVEVIDDSTAIMNGLIRSRERIGFPDIRPFVIGEDYILGVHIDEVGVERVRMYPLERHSQKG